MNLKEPVGLCIAMSSGGLDIGTSLFTFLTANDVVYIIDGRIYTFAATDELEFSAGHTDLAEGEVCVFGLFLDTSGNVSSVQSNIVAAADLAGGIVWIRPPTWIRNKVMFGMIRVETDHSTTFTPGTTELDAAGLTVTYINCASHQSRNIVS